MIVRLTAVLPAVMIALLALPSPAWAVPIPWKNCGGPGDVVSVAAADASVWPPQRGKPITLAIRANAGADAVGSANIEVKVDGIPIVNAVVPVATTAGPLTRTLTFTVPAWIPAGSIFEVHLNATANTGRGIVCVDATIPVK